VSETEYKQKVTLKRVATRSMFSFCANKRRGSVRACMADELTLV